MKGINIESRIVVRRKESLYLKTWSSRRGLTIERKYRKRKGQTKRRVEEQEELRRRYDRIQRDRDLRGDTSDIQELWFLFLSWIISRLRVTYSVTFKIFLDIFKSF